MNKRFKIKRWTSGIGIAGAALLMIIGITKAVQVKDPHQFDGKCSMCHVGMKNPKILTRDSNYLCLTCHPDNAIRSHPSNFIPKQKIPDQYPLYKNKMVCVSCHFPHQKLGKPEPGADPAAPVELGPYMLRAKNAGKVFCFSCHKGNFTTSNIDSHAIAYQKAHSKPLGFNEKEELDHNSQECLSCHDGTVSRAAGTQIRSLSWQHRKNIGLSHPISIDYASVYNRKPREYHPPGALDPRIKLFNGQIGCKTCHDHYSKKKHHLVMDNIGSRLCLACHNL